MATVYDKERTFETKFVQNRQRVFVLVEVAIIKREHDGFCRQGRAGGQVRVQLVGQDGVVATIGQHLHLFAKRSYGYDVIFGASGVTAAPVANLVIA